MTAGQAARVALTGDVTRTALKAGNLPAMIFRHNREVVTEDAASEWLAIMAAEDLGIQLQFDLDFLTARQHGREIRRRTDLQQIHLGQNSLNDLAKAEKVSKFKSPEFGTILRQRRSVLQPGVAVVRRLPRDDSTHGIEPQRGSVLCGLTFKVRLTLIWRSNAR